MERAAVGSSAGFVQPGTPTNSFTSKNEPGEGRAKHHLNHIFRSTAQRGRFLCAAALGPAWPMALGPAQAAAPSLCVLEASSSSVLTGELTTWEDNSDTPRARVWVKLESLEQEGPWWGQGIQQHQHPSRARSPHPAQPRGSAKSSQTCVCLFVWAARALLRVRGFPLVLRELEAYSAEIGTAHLVTAGK